MIKEITVAWIPAPSGQITEHFSWDEAKCRHCGCIPSIEAVTRAAQMMESIRTKIGNRPVKVNSWCRCEKHNAAIGGAPNSYHLKGIAVDFTVKTLSARQVQQKLKNHEGGMGTYLGFTHVDLGPKRRWSI